MTHVSVLQVEHDGSTLRLTLSAPTPLPDDALPATLRDPDRTPMPEVEVHTLVEIRDDVVVVETHDWQGPLPELGRTYDLGPWLTADQLEVIRDLDAVWSLETYPDDGDHDHCLLTWATIAAYGAYERTGYRSTHGWITVAAYEEYIRRDRGADRSPSSFVHHPPFRTCRRRTRSPQRAVASCRLSTIEPAGIRMRSVPRAVRRERAPAQRALTLQGGLDQGRESGQ